MYEIEIRCSGVFYWLCSCSVGIQRFSACVPRWSVVPPLVRSAPRFYRCFVLCYSAGVPLIGWCSVFRCSVVWSSWFYSMPSLSSISDCLYRQVGFGKFILSSYKENTKKLSLQSKYKYIKKTLWRQGQHKKATKLYFNCCPLRKKIY